MIVNSHLNTFKYGILCGAVTCKWDGYLLIKYYILNYKLT